MRAGDHERASAVLDAVRAVVPAERHLKVILETGELGNSALVGRAASSRHRPRCRLREDINRKDERLGYPGGGHGDGLRGRLCLTSDRYQTIGWNSNSR